MFIGVVNSQFRVAKHQKMCLRVFYCTYAHFIYKYRLWSYCHFDLLSALSPAGLKVHDNKSLRFWWHQLQLIWTIEMVVNYWNGCNKVVIFLCCHHHCLTSLPILSYSNCPMDSVWIHFQCYCRQLRAFFMLPVFVYMYIYIYTHMHT